MAEYCWEHDSPGPMGTVSQTTPWAATDLIAQRIRLVDGAVAGAVLVSDGSGCASWLPLADLVAALAVSFDDRYAPKGA